MPRGQRLQLLVNAPLAALRARLRSLTHYTDGPLGFDSRARRYIDRGNSLRAGSGRAVLGSGDDFRFATSDAAARPPEPGSTGLWLKPMTKPSDAGDASALDPCAAGNVIAPEDLYGAFDEPQTRPGDLIVMRSDTLHGTGPTVARHAAFRLAMSWRVYPDDEQMQDYRQCVQTEPERL